MQRLLRAVNTHDLDALVGCFVEDYRNATPTHPARGFSGRDQVHKNWQTIFGAVPDVSAEAHWTTDGTTVWSEWEMRGTRRDGAPHLMRGVVIFGLAGEAAEWARFYLEPVDHSPTTIDGAVRTHVGGATA